MNYTDGVPSGVVLELGSSSIPINPTVSAKRPQKSRLHQLIWRRIEEKKG